MTKAYCLAVRGRHLGKHVESDQLHALAHDIGHNLRLSRMHVRATNHTYVSGVYSLVRHSVGRQPFRVCTGMPTRL